MIYKKASALSVNFTVLKRTRNALGLPELPRASWILLKSCSSSQPTLITTWPFHLQTWLFSHHRVNVLDLSIGRNLECVPGLFSMSIRTSSLNSDHYATILAMPIRAFFHLKGSTPIKFWIYDSSGPDEVLMFIHKKVIIIINKSLTFVFKPLFTSEKFSNMLKLAKLFQLKTCISRKVQNDYHAF